METSWQMLPDLRALRTTFFRRQLAYAMSYEYSVKCASSHASGNLTVQLGLDTSPLRPARGKKRLFVDKADHSAKELSQSRVFHVLGDQRVPGLDGLGHEVPAGFYIRGLDESVALHEFEDESSTDGKSDDENSEISYGSIEGRMVLVAKEEKADGDALRIAVTYEGTLQPTEPIRTSGVDHAKGVVVASAFVIPFFETLHPKYHWLTENACLAFGTWNLREGIVTASFDVYCAG